MEANPQPTLRSTVIALGASLVVCVMFILILGREPSDALYHFFIGPFLSSYHFGNMLDTASLLVLTGLGVSLAFRAGVFNLGGEGQTYLGALVAAQTALAISSWFGFPGVLVAAATGMAAGGAVGFVSGYLRSRWNVDELITSFLVSSALIPIIDYSISGPLRDAKSYLLSTPQIPDQFRLARLLPPSHLNLTAVIALVLSAAFYVLVFKSLAGYELRLSGRNRAFARHVGIQTAAYVSLPMAASGAMHGLAGSMHVLGTRFAAVRSGTVGLGWNGIAVALIADSHPLGVVPAALIFAYLDAATKTAMLHTEFSFELSALVQGMVFLLITVKGLRLHGRWRASRVA